MNSDSSLQVIVIDDEAIVRHSMLQTLQLEGYQAAAYKNPLEAITQCSNSWQGVVICDVRMNLMDGIEVLERILQIDSEIPVIMFSAHADITIAIRAIRLGAYDFLEKADDPQNHLNTVQRAYHKRQLVLENRALKASLAQEHKIEQRLIGQSDNIQKLRESVLRLAQVDVDLIIHGETGTGKEVVAQCLHDYSPRADKPFVALNCGALAENIIESELFGHEAGAFTGAIKKRIGKIEYANAGTLFLDEIESMPLSLQVKLLRVIQERSLQRLGGNTNINVDIRIIAASKVDLLEESYSGHFREDLYYRLNVAAINIPALKQRKADIPLLFSHFAQISANKLKRKIEPITQTLLKQLSANDWPGNVRELQNTAERWVIGLPLSFNALDKPATEHKSKTMFSSEHLMTNHHTPSDLSLDQQLSEHEKNIICQALEQNSGHIEKTAESLDIPRKKLYLRMKKYNLSKDSYT